MRSVIYYRTQFSASSRRFVSLIHILRITVFIVLLSARLFRTDVLRVVLRFVRRYSERVRFQFDRRRCRRRRRRRRRHRRRVCLAVRRQQGELVVLVHLHLQPLLVILGADLLLEIVVVSVQSDQELLIVVAPLEQRHHNSHMLVRYRLRHVYKICIIM